MMQPTSQAPVTPSRTCIRVATLAAIVCCAIATGCTLGDNLHAPGPDASAPTREVVACRVSDVCECTIDGAPVPCGAAEVEACGALPPPSPSLAHCARLEAPSCDDLACEWVVDCDLGGCACVVGAPAGRLTTCYG